MSRPLQTRASAGMIVSRNPSVHSGEPQLCDTLFAARAIAASQTTRLVAGAVENDSV